MSNQNKNNNSERYSALRALAQISQIGFTIAASIIVSVFVGRFLDKLFGTEPWLLLVFSLLGLGAAIKSIYNMSNEQ